MSRYYIANWKMNEAKPSVRMYMQKLIQDAKKFEKGKKIIICPPLTLLADLVSYCTKSSIALGAQNISWKKTGALTGEVSGNMLKAAGARYVIIGHSERRQFFCEIDEMVNAKLIHALTSNLIPIVCIGETFEEKKKKQTKRVLARQLTKAFHNVDLAHKRAIIAYEPVWSLSTSHSGKHMKAHEVTSMQILIHDIARAVISGFENADEIAFIYGGNVNKKNIHDILTGGCTDGVLVGGASLDYKRFHTIITS